LASSAQRHSAKVYSAGGKFNPFRHCGWILPGQRYMLTSMSFNPARMEPKGFAVLRIILPAAALWFCLMATPVRAFTALYVFGDSLSDTGRNPAPSPMYYDGRYCNGPLWVEYLSARLGLPYNASNNFAVSGSTTSNLMSQIAGLPASTILHSGLFTLVSAGNDFLDSAELGVNDAGWNIVITNAVFNLTNAIGALYTNGAREMIVGNLASIGRTPAFIGTPAGYTNYVDSKVALFNTMLESSLPVVMQRSSGLRIYLLDDNTGLSNILSAPAAYGFTVITNGALEDSNLTDKSFNGPGANYVFWDVIHPTTKLNMMTAATAFESVAVQLGIAQNGTNLSLAVSNLYPGFGYGIQSSGDLMTWSNYQTFTATATNTTMTLTNGTSRYFRVGY
jgi:thermolabile hemolysin